MKKILSIIAPVVISILIINLSYAGVFNLTNNQSAKKIHIHKISYGNEVSSFPISAENPKSNSTFPGGRGANQLVIYNSKYGLKTRTNEYGKEAIVRRNRVVEISSMNSIIPRWGYVISGHGKAKDWIERNIIIGAKIDIRNGQITSTITPESYIFEAKTKIDEAKHIINYCKYTRHSTTNAYYYYSKAESSLAQAKKMAKSNIMQTKKYAKSAIIYAAKAIEHAVPYLKTELKGIWLRPTETNQRQICYTLDRLKKSGINNIFLETYYHGVTIFPSATLKKYGLPSQRPEFKGFDPLMTWVQEAHKRRMKVHVWYQTFYIGNHAVSQSPKIFIAKYPSWINRQKHAAKATTPPPSSKEHNGYFLDPANPSVQKFNIELLREIVSRYDVDGINVDYIRYPAGDDANSPKFTSESWGYTKYAINEFKKRHGASPESISTSSHLWQTWEKYRKDKVTDFVAKLKQLKSIKPNITISAVIFPDKEQSGKLKLQDWSKWTRSAYIDAVTPLFLTTNIDLSKDYMRSIKKSSNPKVKIYTGLFEPFTKGEPADLLRQIKTAREQGANGIIIFDYAHFSTPYEQALKTRAFKAK